MLKAFNFLQSYIKFSNNYFRFMNQHAKVKQPAECMVHTAELVLIKRIDLYVALLPQCCRTFKVIRFDPLAPVQKLVKRYTLQMKMFFSVNYIINLNWGCPKIVFSLPEASYDTFCVYQISLVLLLLVYMLFRWKMPNYKI